MPRDPDKLQELESRQQRLVEEILNSLHRATRDRDYEGIFRLLVKSTLEALEHDNLEYVRGLHVWFHSMVRKPIEEFTDNPLERRHLLGRVLEKLLVPIFASASRDYQTFLLTDESLQEDRPQLRGTTPVSEGPGFPVT